jgi:putative flippase GtrA
LLALDELAALTLVFAGALVPEPIVASPHAASITAANTHPNAQVAFRARVIASRLASVSAGGGRYPDAMREQATAVELRTHTRLWHGMRRPANWLQLVRFGIVGGIGFVVNVAVYALFVHSVGVDYRLANVVAWLVAVANNFVLNRHWTFDARDGRAHAQAIRFLIVSLIAEACSLLLLTLFVQAAGIAKVPAQALAVAASMPLNFLGNKLWSFR